MKAVDLRTEYRTNPMGISCVYPRFSWKAEGGKKQKAYQIQGIDEQGNLLWDSGIVESDRMHLIPWGGRALKSREILSWSVTLWDETGTAEHSAEAKLELGLLHREDWQAKWITGAYRVSKKKRYPVDCFEKRFALRPGQRVTKARAYMSACGVYEGYLNGQRMGDFYLAPGHTDYRERVQLQTVDITDLLREGENSLFFQLADGWYRGSVGAWGMKHYYGRETKLLAQIEITYADGQMQVIGTDDSFTWTQDGPIRFADNKDGEIYDARREDFADALWKPARETDHHTWPVPSDNFPIKKQERFTDPKVIRTPSGKTVLDFGQNIAGILSFTVTAGSGQRIFLRFGELMRDGEFTQANIQCVRGDYRSPLQQVEYICKEGVNTYETRFAIFGFQYVQVETELEVHPEDFTAIAVYSDFEKVFSFDSSNALLNRFVEATLWSLKNNSADVPTDCPTRERHGWSGDAQIFVNTASYMVNYAPFALKYERDLCDWQQRYKSGAFPQIAPEGGTDPYMRTMNGSVGWADAGVLIPYRLWKRYGDRRILETFYENMKLYGNYMIARTGKTTPFLSEKTGLRKEERRYLYNKGQHYGEWAEPKEVHAVSYKDFLHAKPEEATAYLSYVMGVLCEIAEELGKAEDAAKFAKYRDSGKRTYQKLRQMPAYTLNTDRQARLVRPLYLDLLDETDTVYARKRLIKAMDAYNWRVGTGFLSTPFILYVLEQIDPEYAYRLLENEEKPGWLYMAKTGASTVWEDWDGPDSDNRTGGGIASLDHYSKGAVCEWVFERMCGISVLRENTFRIAPVPGGHFTHASFSYESVYGRVSCAWEKQEDGSISYHIEIPPNTGALVELPGRERQEMKTGTYTIHTLYPGTRREQ